MQILVPISGRSPFFPETEYFFPKPLIEVAGQSMIELVVNQLKRSFSNPKFVFVVERDESRAFSLDRTLALVSGGNSVVIERLGETSGALCSCLLALDALDPNAPLLISNSDQIITSDLGNSITELDAQGADAGVVTFNSVHPRWSYVVDAGEQTIAQAFEKKVVSRNAVAGIYWFRKASQFIEAAKRAILNDSNVGGQYFISASINQTILMGGLVKFTSIDATQYHSFYAPSRITHFERSEFAKSLPPNTTESSQVNIIVPAAGEGSRFAKVGWKKPKPFIDINGEPMLNHVIRNVTPKGAKTTLLLRQEHMEQQPETVKGLREVCPQIVPVSQLTEGTACTVLLARKHFDDNHPMLIANSDQLVDFDVSDYVQDCIDRDLDGSILVFRDPTLDTKWSFAKVDANGLVTEVAEKKPISDLATVGIYLFRRGCDFVGGAADMIAENLRVNGEFYSCPVYNHLIRNGARIGVYEVKMEDMHGLGTPDDLTQYLENNALPPSADRPDSQT